MIRVLGYVSVVACLIASAPAVADPGYNGVFVARVGQDAKDISLERAQAEVKSRLKALGFGGGESNYQINGEHSPVRFHSNQHIFLIARAPGDGSDPEGKFKIMRTTSKKGVRQFGGTTVGMLHGKANSLETVPLSVVPYKAGYVKMSLGSGLTPGEYCATAGIVAGTEAIYLQSDLPVVYCFGID